jgi:hypothetical protein
MLRHRLVLLLVACAAVAQSGNFEAELAGGQKFEKGMGHGLVFRLAPQEGGWEIGVGPRDPAACPESQDTLG